MNSYEKRLMLDTNALASDFDFVRKVSHKEFTTHTVTTITGKINQKNRRKQITTHKTMGAPIIK